MGFRNAELSSARLVCLVGAVVAAAVIAAAVLSTMVIGSTGSDLIRLPFRLMCHGQADRSFEIAATAMPICARCTGVYSGIAFSAALLFVAAPSRRRKLVSAAGLILMAPMVVDGTMQLFGIWSTGNVPRSITGLLFGAGLIIAAANGLASVPRQDLVVSEVARTGQ